MYTSYFGFRENPFSVTPDPHFFYTNAVYKEALAILQYGIDTKKGFIVITGEVGTGKTTLLRKFMHHLGRTVHSVFIFNTHLSFNELLQLTLRDLGLPTQEKDRLTMVEELNRYLIEQLKNGHVVSMLIDEAQNLSDEALEGLRLLSNLETDKEKLLQIVLMGQPELKAKLDQQSLRQLKQRVALQCQLAPLDASEVGAYIDFRVNEAGYRGDELFDSGAVDQIIQYSRGIPRLINIICDNALLIAFGTSKRKVTMKMIHEVAHDLGLERQPEVAVPPMEISTTGATQAPSQRVRARWKPSQLSRRAQVRIGSAIALFFLVAGTTFSQHTVPNLKNFIGSLLENSQDRTKLEASSARYPQPADTLNTASNNPPANQEPQRVTISFERNGAANNLRPQRTDPGRAEAEQPLDHRQIEKKEKVSSLGTFEVIGASLVRDKPRSDAEMIATLLPGMRVNVVSTIGSYLQVRSIDRGRIHGYVHREDAFLKRSQKSQQQNPQYSSLNR